MSADYIIDGDGRRAIQKRLPLALRMGTLMTEQGRTMAVSFTNAWKKFPSGGIPVWQMRKTFLHALQFEGL